MEPQNWNTKSFQWSISAPTKPLKMIDGWERHDRNITYGAQTIAALARSGAMERGRSQTTRGGGPAKWWVLASGWDGERPGGRCKYIHRNNTQNLEYCGNLLERNLGGRRQPSSRDRKLKEQLFVRSLSPFIQAVYFAWIPLKF